MVGFDLMQRLATLKREDFFGSPTADLPGRKATFPAGDDLVPQFGFVGRNYETKRILLLAAVPGNGRNDRREPGDETMIPSLRAFHQHPTPETCRAATDAHMKACPTFLFWKRNCVPVLETAGLSLDDIAFVNSLPWRSSRGTKLTPEQKKTCATRVVGPVLDDLRPNLVVALVKSRTTEILDMCGWRHGDERIVPWNSSHHGRASDEDERREALDRIRRRAAALA